MRSLSTRGNEASLSGTRVGDCITVLPVTSSSRYDHARSRRPWIVAAEITLDDALGEWAEAAAAAAAAGWGGNEGDDWMIARSGGENDDDAVIASASR